MRGESGRRSEGESGRRSEGKKTGGGGWETKREVSDEWREVRGRRSEGERGRRSEGKKTGVGEKIEVSSRGKRHNGLDLKPSPQGKMSIRK